MAITGKGKNELIGWGFAKNKKGKSVVNRLTTKMNFADSDQSEKTIWKDWFFDSGVVSYTLTCAVAALALTGASTSLKAERKLPVTTSAYTETGINTGLNFGHNLLANNVSFIETGVSANTVVARKLPTSVSSFVYNGIASGLAYGHKLNASFGAYNFVGNNVILTYTPITGYNLTAINGSFSFSGTNATLLASRKIQGNSSAYNVIGLDSILNSGRKLLVSVGIYSYSGIDILLKKGYSLLVANGGFVIVGNNVGFFVPRNLIINKGDFVINNINAGIDIRGIIVPGLSGGTLKRWDGSEWLPVTKLKRIV